MASTAASPLADAGAGAVSHAGRGTAGAVAAVDTALRHSRHHARCDAATTPRASHNVHAE